MADNIDITPGAGKTVATDDCGAAGHTQVLKLAVSADGSATYIPADATNGLDVDVTRLSVEMVDNAAFTDAASKVVPAGFYFDDSASGGTSLTENDVAAARVDGKRAVVIVGEDQTTRAQRWSIDSSGRLSVKPDGNVAHDSADSGNPIKIGLKAETSPAGVTLVADGDRTDAYGDADGILMVKPYTSNADLLAEAFSTTSASETASTNFGATASARNHITSIHAFNTSATAVYVELRDGSGGTVFYRFLVPAAGGVTISFPTPLRQPTANTALYYDPSAAVSTLYVNLTGFKSKA